MKNIVKILIASFAITALLFAAGCRKQPDTPAPPTDINVTLQGGGAIPADFTLTVNGTRSLTVSAMGAASYDWDVDDTSKIQIVSGGTAATAVFKGLAEGNTNIRAFARNNDGNISHVISVRVIAAPSVPSLVLTVLDGGNAIENEGIVVLYIDDGVKTLAAQVKDENGADVTGAAITWNSAHPEIVTAANGAITPVAAGQSLITVSASKDGYENAVTVFTVNVVSDINYTNVLFLWSNTGPGFGSGSAAMTSSGHAWVHPDADEFMAQRDNMRVTTLRTFGNGIRTDSDPNTAILLGVGAGSNNNPRLAIGQTENTATGTHTAATNPAGINFGGQIDLYRKQARLIIDYKDASTTSGYLLRAYIGNNGTGEGQSIFGTASNLGTYRDPAHPGAGAFHDILEANPGNTLAAGRVIFEIDTTTETFTSLANEAYLANTFIALHTQGGTTQNAQITITGIRLEYIPSSKGNINVEINPEAVFNGFPADDFILSISAAGGNPAALTITLGDYTTAEWFINGVSFAANTNSITVASADWAVGVWHNLTVFITAVNGELYSKSVTFTVTQ